MKKIILISGLIFSYFISFSFPGKIVSSFELSAFFSTGMTYDGKFLWVADRKTDFIYKINPSDGKVVDSLKSPAYWITGLAWDGTYLWAVDYKGGLPKAENYHGVLYKIDIKSGIILKTVELSIIKPGDLAFDGKFIWVVEDYGDKLIQIDPNDGTTIMEIPAPATRPRGLTWDGEYLWVSDVARNKIYMVEPTTGAVIITTDSPGEVPEGLAFDGTFLFNNDSYADKVYKLIRKDNEKFFKYNKLDNVILTYYHQTTNFGPGKIKNLDVYLAVPENRANQDILKIEYSQKVKILTDKWGQKCAHFQFTNLQQGTRKEVFMRIYANLYDVNFFVFPEETGTVDMIPDDIRSKYLADDLKYQYNHPVIRKAVEEAVGNEKNVYWIVRKIFDYLRMNMYYEMAGGWNTAPTVLARGNGSCSEYSFVFISMCRSAGIPARYVGSVAQRGEKNSLDDIFHRWVEVYMPNYGWIPVDPSGGDVKLPADQARGIGHLSNRFLITTQSGGGSEYLEWTYNSNDFYETEPQTYVVTEYFGQWDIPVDF